MQYNNNVIRNLWNEAVLLHFVKLYAAPYGTGALSKCYRIEQGNFSLHNEYFYRQACDDNDRFSTKQTSASWS